MFLRSDVFHRLLHHKQMTLLDFMKEAHCSPLTLVKALSGKDVVQSSTRFRWAQALGCSVMDIFVTRWK